MIEAALAGGLPVERLAIEPHELAGLAVDLTAAGDVRTLPCHLAAARRPRRLLHRALATARLSRYQGSRSPRGAAA